MVLHINRASAETWQGSEVIHRWHQLFKGTLLSQRFTRGEKLTEAEQQALNETIQLWRQRLQDLSWFMRLLNEPIAREANREDQCTGRFWEGRFKSQALLDEKALAACMAYVDLNPIRAELADSPETSNHTSVKKRIDNAQAAHNPNHSQQQTEGLMPFAGGTPRQNMPHGRKRSFRHAM